LQLISCHNLSMGGTDSLRTSIGHNWQEGPVNAPTVLNSSLSLAQFRDGRAAYLYDDGVSLRVFRCSALTHSHL
jgi:cytochrome c peroxidase